LTGGNGSAKIRSIKMAQAVEQRVHLRFKYPLKVSGIGEYQVFEARAENLSLSGACLWSPVAFSPGKSLGLILKLPGAGKFLVIPAEVVWSRAFNSGSGEDRRQIGIKYLYLSPDLEDGFKELFKVLR